MKVLSTFALVLGNAVIISFGVCLLLLDLIRTGNGMTPWIVGALLIAAYVWLASRCAKDPDLEVDDPNEPVITLPEPGPTIRSGLHYPAAGGC